MADATDMELVREFAGSESEAAFTELVRRHVNLVYSVALRCARNPDDAHDVTQAVFIILAQKAARLSERTVLTGWLYETTRFVAARLVRTNARRLAREQKAYMQSTLNQVESEDVWRSLEPHLEAAMSGLGAADRQLVALRFYENKSGPEAAALLGVREDAVHKRTARAVAKLRKFFTRRGVTLSSVAIVGAVSANSVQAAPAALAGSVTAMGIAKGAAASASTVALIKGALKLMAWAKAKTAIVSGAGILLALGLGGAIVLNNTDRLAALEILAKTQDKYASLTNYADTGESFFTTFVRESPSEVIGRSTNRFALKLARPILYRVEWEDLPPNVGSGVAWSAGAGHYVLFAALTSVQISNAWVNRMFTNYSKATVWEYALVSPMALSSHASTAMPSTFFSEDRLLEQDNVLSTNWPSNCTRQRDETIRGVDCYVLSITPRSPPPPRSSRPVQRTLWIGKQDFLIRQSEAVRDFQQTVPLKTDAEIAAHLQGMNNNRLSPALLARLVREQQQSEAKLRRPRRTVNIQIHSDIRVNQPMSAGDFIPPLPPDLGTPGPLNL